MDTTATSWITPPSRPELIENLVSGVGMFTSYREETILILQQIAITPTTWAYWRTTCITRSGTRSTTVLQTLQFWSCNASYLEKSHLIYLFFRYQFNPELYNPDIVINVLVKALTACPLPDFNLCVSLLDEKPINAQLEEPDPLPTLLPILRGLHDLLFRCRFPAFWDVYRSDDLESLRDNYTVEVAGFDNEVRQVVVRAVKAAFKRISTARLGSYLALSGLSYGESTAINKLMQFIRRWFYWICSSTRVDHWLHHRSGEYPPKSRQPDRGHSHTREYQATTYVLFYLPDKRGFDVKGIELAKVISHSVIKA